MYVLDDADDAVCLPRKLSRRVSASFDRNFSFLAMRARNMRYQLVKDA